MNKELKLGLLGILGATKTRFATVNVPANASNGIAIGQGSCKGVILRLNQFLLDTQTGTATPISNIQFYYGDAKGQFFEQFRGANSELILCNDLSEVYVRNNGVAIDIQVLIYE